jgi:hypothetical protein
MRYHIVCPDNDEIIPIKARTVEAAKRELKCARERHKAELYELDHLRGWVHVDVPEREVK